MALLVGFVLDQQITVQKAFEFVFRFNRRRSRSRGMVFYRVLELAVAHDPVRYRELILNPRPTTAPRTASATRGRPESLDRSPANRPWRSNQRAQLRLDG